MPYNSQVSDVETFSRSPRREAGVSPKGKRIYLICQPFVFVFRRAQGNHYSTPGGTNSNQGTSYHYSNSDGSYYYANDNGACLELPSPPRASPPVHSCLSAPNRCMHLRG